MEESMLNWRREKVEQIGRILTRSLTVDDSEFEQLEKKIILNDYLNIFKSKILFNEIHS